MEVPVTKATAGKARKRTRNPENWKVNIAKKERLVMCLQVFRSKYRLLYYYVNTAIKQI